MACSSGASSILLKILEEENNNVKTCTDMDNGPEQHTRAGTARGGTKERDLNALYFPAISANGGSVEIDSSIEESPDRSSVPAKDALKALYSSALSSPAGFDDKNNKIENIDIIEKAPNNGPPGHPRELETKSPPKGEDENANDMQSQKPPETNFSRSCGDRAFDARTMRAWASVKRRGELFKRRPVLPPIGTGIRRFSHPLGGETGALINPGRA